MNSYQICWIVSFRQKKSVKNGKASFWHFENERFWFSHLKLLPYTNFPYFIEYLNLLETKINLPFHVKQNVSLNSKHFGVCGVQWLLALNSLKFSSNSLSDMKPSFFPHRHCETEIPVVLHPLLSGHFSFSASNILQNVFNIRKAYSVLQILFYW